MAQEAAWVERREGRRRKEEKGATKRRGEERMGKEKAFEGERQTPSPLPSLKGSKVLTSTLTVIPFWTAISWQDKPR